MKKYFSGSDRRNFLKKGLAGLSGMIFLPGLVKAQTNQENKTKFDKDKFIYRTLGKTGIKLPVISMGVMNANNPHLVKAALEAGIVHLDTAWYYQNGRNEEMIGEVIKDRPRDSYVIATKIYEHRDRRTGLFPRDASPKSFAQKFETSLKRLGLDYVDILYLHNISRKESVLFEPYLNEMKKFKKDGKVRFLGISTHRNEPEIITATTDSKEYDVILTAYNFKQQHHQEVKKAIDYAANAGMGIVGMKAIAGSVYNIGRQVKVNAKAALKWALQPENIHTNIAGFTTFDQMYEDLALMQDLKLSPEEEAELGYNKTQQGLYCQQCEKCIPQCPQNIEIPTLMRSYMYAYGYKNMNAAKETLASLNIKNNICSNCKICSVQCSMNFDVKEKIQKITRIKDVPDDFLV